MPEAYPTPWQPRDLQPHETWGNRYIIADANNVYFLKLPSKELRDRIIRAVNGEATHRTLLYNARIHYRDSRLPDLRLRQAIEASENALKGEA